MGASLATVQFCRSIGSRPAWLVYARDDQQGGGGGSAVEHIAQVYLCVSK